MYENDLRATGANGLRWDVGGGEPTTVPAFSHGASLHASLAVLIDSNPRRRGD